MDTKSLFVALLAVCAFLCIKAADNQLPLVLVHGAAVSGDAWIPVLPLLKGPSASNPSQRGRVGNQPEADPAAITFKDYVDDITDEVNKVDTGNGVILVGHSFGGLLVSQVGENLGPQKVRALIYVAAYIPATKVIGDNFNDHLSADTNSVIPLWVTKDPNGNWVTINNASAVFLNDCPDNTATATEANVIQSIKEPTAPFATNVTYTDGSFGKIPKYFIHTLLDTAVTPDFQETEYMNLQMNNVTSINAGHAPMLCKPQLLADAINPITSAISDIVLSGGSHPTSSASYLYVGTAITFSALAIAAL